MKGILITDQNIFKVDFEEDSIYKLLNCDQIETMKRVIGNKTYMFIIDEDGMLKENNHLTAICDNYNELIFGNILITNIDEENNYISSLSLSDFNNIVKNFTYQYGSSKVLNYKV